MFLTFTICSFVSIYTARFTVKENRMESTIYGHATNMIFIHKQTSRMFILFRALVYPYISREATQIDRLIMKKTRRS